MTDHYDVPIVATGDWIDAAWINQYIGDNVRAWRQGFAAGGDIPYAVDANTIAALNKPASRGLLQNTSIGVPSYLLAGSAGQYLKVNNSGAFEFASFPVQFCAVQNSTDFSHTSGVISWNTNFLDLYNWHSTTVDPSIIRPGTGYAGYYIAGATISHYESGGGALVTNSISVRKNGTEVPYSIARYLITRDSISKDYNYISPPIYCDATAYLELAASIDGGRTVIAANSMFWIMRIG